MKISVIIPTNRPGGLELARASLARQTLTDFEVLVGSSFEPGFGRWIRDDFVGGFWTLNRIYNRLFSEAKGELLVSLQDFIYMPTNGLERFWWIYENTGGLITGIGDLYEKVELDGSHGKAIWSDGRRFIHEIIKTKEDPSGAGIVTNIAQIETFGFLEFNYAAIPKEATSEVGGMDEELDFIGYGCDNVSIAERILELKKRPFFIDFKNEIFSQGHGRPSDWDTEAHMSWKTIMLNDRLSLYNRRKEELKRTHDWPTLTERARRPSLLRRK